ncbi:MAG: nucleotidyltransferase domain-containing protein [Armatimonadota bacterium]
MNIPVHLDDERVARFCRDHHVVRLSLFGSVLTSRFSPLSDVDVLVEFEAGKEPSLFGMSQMERELSEIVGRQVDLRTPEDLSPYFREKVVAGAERVYAS